MHSSNASHGGLRAVAIRGEEEDVMVGVGVM